MCNSLLKIFDRLRTEGVGIRSVNQLSKSRLRQMDGASPNVSKMHQFASGRSGTPNEASTARLARAVWRSGPSVPTLRRLTRAPSISRNSVSASSPGCEAPAASQRVGQTVALPALEFLDHPQARMALFGQFDRGVGEIAAALVLGDESRRLLEKAIELADRIAGVGALDLGPDLFRLLALVVEIFEDQFVLRFEMTVERHLVGAGRLGDRLDADAANAVAWNRSCAVAKIRSRGRGAQGASAMPRRLVWKFLLPWLLTAMLPIGISTSLPVGNMGVGAKSTVRLLPPPGSNNKDIVMSHLSAPRRSTICCQDPLIQAGHAGRSCRAEPR